MTTETTTDDRGRRPEPRLHRGRRLRLLQAVQPQGRHRDALPRGLGRRGRHDRGAPATRRPARSSARRRTITPTGDWQTFKDVQLTLTNPPTGTHELFLVFRNRGSTQNLFNVNWFEFVGKGAAHDGFAGGDRHGHARQRHRAADRRVRRHGDRHRRRHAHLRVGLRRARHHHGHLDRRAPSYTYADAGHLHGHADRHRRPGRHHDQDVTSRSRAASGCSDGVRDDFNGADLGAELGGRPARPDADRLRRRAERSRPRPATSTRPPTTPRTSSCARRRPAPGRSPRRSTSRASSSTSRPASSSTATTTTTRSSIASRPTPRGNAGVEKFEFINEVAGTPRNGSADASANLAATFPNDFCMRVKSDGTNITGEYSTDGTTWTPVGRRAALPANAKVGVFALSNAAATTVDAKFDYVTARRRPTCRRRSRPGDDFTARRWTRRAGTRSSARTRRKYTVANGGLTITTVAGDINTNSDPSGTRNFILQSADHAGSDYVLETKLSGTITGGYSQGGLIIYTDDDNYVKLDAISDSNQTRINRIELRSEQARRDPEPAAAGHRYRRPHRDDRTIWLRLTKTGTTLQGRVLVRRDHLGLDVRDRRQHADRPEVRPLHARRAGRRRGQDRDLRLLQGQRLDGLRQRRPRNASPVITSATATPTAGFAPLATTFTAAATDADDDALTYSWDFDGNGTADATGATASTTFTTAGDQDGEADGHRRQGRHRHPGRPGHGARPPTTPPKKLRALVFSKTAGLPARLDPGRASPRSRRSGTQNATGRSTLPRTRRCSRTRSSPLRRRDLHLHHG